MSPVPAIKPTSKQIKELNRLRAAENRVKEYLLTVFDHTGLTIDSIDFLIKSHKALRSDLEFFKKKAGEYES